MSKYIDLLREHNQEPEKKKNKKKNKKKGKNTAKNPYSHQDESDNALLDEMAALLDEHENEQTSIIDDYDEKQNILITEESTPKPIQEKEGITFSVPEIDTYGFDLTSWLGHVEQSLTTTFIAVQNNERFNINILEEHLNTLFDQIHTSPKVIDTLELEINKHLQSSLDTHHHADLVQKAILMMLYTMKVGMQLSLKLQELLPYTIAAMLHHLGMAMVPAELRQKIETLTADEIQQIKRAPQSALTYLDTHHVQHKQLHAAISQSGERYNGSGAQELAGHDITWVARLVSLLSMFEALIHLRPYRQRLLPRDAIREIVKFHKKEFDPEMLKALIESISLYPVGTFVQLNTGEVGQVINIHNKFPLRPVVYINMDKYGHAIMERKVDLKKQPNLMIQKCMYEEGLKDLAET